MQTPSGSFPRETAGLAEARSPEIRELADGEQFDLRIAPVAKRLNDTTVRMLAYNGSIPGPTLRVRQGTELTVNVANHGDLEATVHWHGLRVDNRYDGTAATQRPIPIGGRFSYRLRFPDPGVYWYHPHIREDYGQEMGLYGNILVAPSEPDYWPPVNRELVLTLDDILLEGGRVSPFTRSQSTHTAMGRFGNVMLVNGETQQTLAAHRGEVLRLYLTDTANTRVFNVGLRGARLKLVGGDSGHYEREEFVESVLIAPSERAVVDVLLEQPGELMLEHRTPHRTYPLVRIDVAEAPEQPSLVAQFESLRTNADMVAERERLASSLSAAPDKTLALVAEMNLDEPVQAPGASVAYACPMHPEVISETPDGCLKCGMKLLAVEAPPTVYACPMHAEVRSERPDRCPKCGMKLVATRLMRGAVQDRGHGANQHGAGPANARDRERAGHEQGHEHGSHGDAHPTPVSGGPARDFPPGIEWEDDMVEVNRRTTPANTRWKLIDRATGAEGHAIDWVFRVGDRVKIRLVNEMESDHPMHHPFHIHGAGRFLVLSRDGVVEPNLVWKDTVLVATGQTVDVLLEVTNAGLWMAHCHIAEHHEGGMMLSFRVEP